MNDLISVSSQDVAAAFNNWRTEMWKFQTKKYKTFWDYIGEYPDRVFEHPPSFITSSYLMTPDQVHKVRLMLSPHHSTIMKAWHALQEAS